VTMQPQAEIGIIRGDSVSLVAIGEIMESAFDAAYGEAWTVSQCSAILGMPGSWLLLAEESHQPSGFALTRSGGGDAELLLIAVKKMQQNRGVGEALLRAVIADARARGIERLFLEVRSCNPAIRVYKRAGFSKIGERRDYYRGKNGLLYDAHSYRLVL